MTERNRWQWSINIAISQLEKLLREGAVAVSGGYLVLFPVWSWNPLISPPLSFCFNPTSPHITFPRAKLHCFSYSFFNSYLHPSRWPLTSAHLQTGCYCFGFKRLNVYPIMQLVQPVIILTGYKQRSDQEEIHCSVHTEGMLFFPETSWLHFSTEQLTAFSSSHSPISEEDCAKVLLCGAFWFSCTTKTFLSYIWKEDRLSVEQGFLKQNMFRWGLNKQIQWF